MVREGTTVVARDEAIKAIEARVGDEYIFEHKYFYTSHRPVELYSTDYNSVMLDWSKSLLRVS